VALKTSLRQGGKREISKVKDEEQEFDLTPVSQAEIEAAGARPRKGEAPHERGEDLLERYIKVPNRMLILYSSEDDVLSRYVREHWAALDSLSGDICDIFLSLLQLTGDEDIYSFLDDLHYIPGAETIRIDKLPMILLWSDSASLSISLKEFADDVATLRNVLRGVFQCLHDIGRGITIEDEGRFDAMLRTVMNKKDARASYSITIDRRVTVNNTTNNNADRGSVILSDNSKARNISINQSSSIQGLDLSKLSEELARLRAAMKVEADGADPAHDVAVGHVASAEAAAKKGDRNGALAALKSAGSWALEIAQKIGVEVAVAAIKGVTSGAGAPPSSTLSI
jgi:hypothetical protein